MEEKVQLPVAAGEPRWKVVVEGHVQTHLVRLQELPTSRLALHQQQPAEPHSTDNMQHSWRSHRMPHTDPGRHSTARIVLRSRLPRQGWPLQELEQVS